MSAWQCSQRTAAEETARLARGVPEDQLTQVTPWPDYDVEAMLVHVLQEVVLHGWDLSVCYRRPTQFVMPPSMSDAELSTPWGSDGLDPVTAHSSPPHHWSSN